MILLSSAVTSSSGVLGPVSAGAGLFARKAPLGGVFELGCESFLAPQLKAIDTSGTPKSPHAMSRASGPAERGDELRVLGREMIRFTGGLPSGRSLPTSSIRISADDLAFGARAQPAIDIAVDGFLDHANTTVAEE